ncbi:protoheme IX farnesyltransferase [Gordoniibacillus kamchatkensis]|uniref:Protoheme IX farnesyltransferase n=1 Tax=Gordoniibacillus kamchatkensis TaxID=1590651 RepID=A0ABR5AN25_9BACL|nr:heme o synthase [Paenibacillus sp. VKM B-2647]KIL42414.1 protoheme IX farnesyltransferase [Paenibacillus sp. VKM B-2647]
MNNPISLDAAGEPAAEAVQAADSAAAKKSLSMREFVNLMKPGIVFHNLIAAIAGFWVASRWHVDWLLLLTMTVGTALIVASGCTLNNYLDRELDAKMARTQSRALVTGKMSPRFVLGYGITLGVLGTFVLGVLVNPLAALLGLIGLFLYVWVYTMWFKRTSVWSTFVGSFSGAVPPVIGYVAVTQTMDAGAWILFLILFLWQPPHFWALGIRRMEEYRAAGFPLLPVVRGSYVTKISIVRYVVLLVPVSMLLYLYGYVGEVYMIAAAALGLIWAFMSIAGFRAEDENKWAKRMFVYSINYLTIMIVLMIANTVH